MEKRVEKAGSKPDTTPYDSQWKMAITEFSKPFMELCFPNIANEIDWGRDWESLDKELLPDKADDEVGRRDADLLFRVYRNNGEDRWVLIHVEVQSQRQVTEVFLERVWVYASRIRLRYQKKLCCLVVLADLNPTWKPERFVEELWGCEISLRFPTAKLLQLEKRLDAEPSLSRNPVAMIVRIHLAAQRHTPDSTERRNYKRQFLLELRRGIREDKLDVYEREDIRRLLALIDGFLSLSAENDKLFREELDQDEEITQMKNEMAFLTTFERWAVEEERQRTEEERQRAEEERQRAELAEERANRLAAQLRELGVDPEI